MGGCCCCFSKGAELNSSPRFYHYPIAEERQPLSSNSGVASALSTGLLVDTNLETSIPDTYRPPPAPIPYDVTTNNPRSPLNNRETSGIKPEPPLQTNNTEPVGEITISDGETVAKEAKGSDCKEITNIELVETKETETEIEKSGELKKPSGPILPPEECPTCLEEYDEENPKIITKCEHHFHLSCILEWMERSDTCPVCDQEMIINFPVNE
ncbi:RING/U-box superfamily protein [Artemisia annua]|uniref:RING-type E3 ubiquitin transferase n=1 Tax=Artemisia annua TaxID=35608 RepID=A0A2U1M4T4_ARTAN|nr:RING/U-box superfamily protein [Artemisia annua]